MDEQELQEMIRKLQETGGATEDFGDKVKDAGKSVYEFSKGSMIDLTKSVGAFSSSVLNGKKDFDSLNPIIESVGKSAAGLASMMPFVGGAAKGLINAVTAGSKLLVTQLDRQRKTFSAVSSSGLILDGNLTNFSNTAFSTLMNLEDFGKIVTENGQVLARMSGTAGQGTQAFANLATTLTNDQTVRRLGYSAEEIGDITAGFIKQQTRLGQSQGRTTDELNASTYQYITELDTLSRLTGQNRKDLQAQQDSLQREARFGTMIQRMNSAGQEKQAKAMSSMVMSISGFSPRMAEGLKDIMTSGTATTEEGRQLMMLSGNAVKGIIGDLKSGNIDYQTATQRLQKSLSGAEKQYGSQAQILGNANPMLADFASIVAFTKASLADLEEGAKQTADQQNSSDTMLTNLVSASTNIDKLSANLNKIILDNGLPLASDVVAIMTTAMEEFTNKIPLAIDHVKSYYGGDRSMLESTLDLTTDLLQKILDEVRVMGIGVLKSAFGNEESDESFMGRLRDMFNGMMLGGGTGVTLGTMGGPLGMLGGGVLGTILGGYMGYKKKDAEKILGLHSGKMKPPSGNQDELGHEPRALGGPTMRGQPYLVGELGPELFVPGSMGNIIPNYGGDNRTGLEDLAGPKLSRLSKVLSDFSTLAIPNTTTATQQQTALDANQNVVPELLAGQSVKLDELIRLTQRQLSVSDSTRKSLM